MEKDKTKGRQPKEKAARKRSKQINTTPIYVLLLLMLAIYVGGQSIRIIAYLAGIIAVILIAALLILEIKNSFNETGYAKNMIELAAAILLVVVFWFALRFLLNTTNPIDVVPSCSMLPALQRGDLILIQGIGTSISSIKAPTVQITKSQAASLTNGSESLECVAYRYSGQGAYISQYFSAGDSVGLYRSSPYGGQIIPQSGQGNNTVKYACGIQQVRFENGTTRSEAYTSSISILNHTISGDLNNSVVVYMTTPSDLFYQEGDSFIVHRVYAILNASGTYYFLTKGDNNPGLDMQYSNIPANITQVQGKVLLNLPYLGYLKLLLSGSTVPPAGCNSTVVSA